MCSGSVEHPILSASKIYDGDVDTVRSALSGHLQPEQLERLINVVRRFNKDSPNYSTTEGTVKNIQILFIMSENPENSPPLIATTFPQFEMFAILAASKSSQDEKSWFKALTKVRTAVLSSSETDQYNADAPTKDSRFGLFTFLIRSRVPVQEDAQQILNILSKLESGLESLEGWFGRLTFALHSQSEYKNGQVVIVDTISSCMNVFSRRIFISFIFLLPERFGRCCPSCFYRKA